MNTAINGNYQLKGLTSKEVFTPEEIKQFEKTLSLKKVKKGTAVAVGASTIFVTSVSANADFTSKFISKDLFEKKAEHVMMVKESAEPSIELVETNEIELVETKEETTLTEQPAAETLSLEEVKTTSEKSIEETIETLGVSQHETEFLNAIKEGAFDSWKEYGILPSILAAQAVLESEWGTSELALYGNALFGVKASDWSGKTYTKRTREVYDGKEVYINAAFRAYDSWTDSMIDHGNFLNKERYQKAIGERNYEKSITAIFEGGYATDPIYIDKITGIIETYHLEQWDQAVINAYDSYIDSIGPHDMTGFVDYLNSTTSQNRIEKIKNLTKEEAITTFVGVGAEAMKNWKNAEMESLFQAFQDENMNKFLHGNYKNKYLDRVAELALVIIGEATPTKEQAAQLRTMEVALEGQVKVGNFTLSDEAGIEAYVTLEEKINSIDENYATISVPHVVADFSGKIIVLDPGHGGNDIGAPNIYENGLNEAKHNLLLVQQLKSELEAQGATVYVTNDGSNYVELEDRVKFAVEKKADVFFSIHFNSNKDRFAEGTEIFYDSSSAEGKRLASTLFPYQKQALHTLATRSNGANTANYKVLRTASAYNLPAVLTEALFMSNPYEVLLLDNENVQTSLVNGYVAGLADYFALSKEVKGKTDITSDTSDTLSDTLIEENVDEQAITPETKEETKEEIINETEKMSEKASKTTNDTSTAVEELPTKEEKESADSSVSTSSNETVKNSFFLFEMLDGFAKK